MDLKRANPHLNEFVKMTDEIFFESGGSVAVAWDRVDNTSKEFMKNEIRRCIADPRHYLANYHTIRTEQDGLKTMSPFWDSQELFYEEVMAIYRKSGKVLAQVLKARQLGLSTICEGLIFWKTLFTPTCNALIVASDIDKVDHQFEMSRLAYDCLPWWMQPEVRYEQKGRVMVFDRRDDLVRKMNPGLRSNIYVEAANKSTGVARGKCQTPWSHVWTERGPLTLENIFTSTCDTTKVELDADGVGEWFTPEKPISVWSFDGAGMVLKPVTRVYRQRYIGAIQDLDVANGARIEKTASHALLSGGNWKKEFEAKDYVDRVDVLPWHGTDKPSDEFAELLAWQIAEGSEGKYNTLYLTQKDDAMRGRIASMAQAVTGRQPLNRQPENRAGYVLMSGPEYRQSLEAKGYEWHRRSRQKKVPEFVFSWCKESIAIFLRTYFEAEGSVADKVEISSASKQVAESLRMLCAIFGISLRFRPCVKYAANTKRKIRRTYFRGNIGGPSLVRFAQHIGFLSDEKQRPLLALAEKASGTNVEVYPRVTQMFREACRASGTPMKKIMGSTKYSRHQNFTRQSATQALDRLESVANNIPCGADGKVHHYYRNCRQEILREHAIRIRAAMQLPTAEEQINSVGAYDYDGYIYDVEVEDTHNYVTKGVITHNTIRAAHLSELATWECGGETLTEQIFPSMNATDTMAFMESTAEGRSGFWYRWWKDTEDGKTDWHPIFIPFYKVRKYARPLDKGEVLVPTPDEEQFRAAVLKDDSFYITDEILKWRRITVAQFVSLTGDEFGFMQEFPANSMEAFQGKGVCAFNKRLLHKMLSGCEAPRWVGEINLEPGTQIAKPQLRRVGTGEVLHAPKTFDRFWVWEEPDPNSIYYVAADVAQGNEGGDFSVVQVLKIGAGMEPDVQVAEWRGWINPTPFAYVIAAVGYWYNTAEIAVECNGVGKVTNNEIFRVIEYDNVYRWKHLDKIKNSLTNFIGWDTNYKSREALIAKMGESVNDRSITLRSKWLIDEMMDFAYDDDGGGKAQGQATKDDRVMAMMICRYCAHDSDYGKHAMARPMNSVPSSGAPGVWYILDPENRKVGQYSDHAAALAAFEQFKVRADLSPDRFKRPRDPNRPALSGYSIMQAPQERDFSNTLYSPIHHGYGIRSRMHYDMGYRAEDINHESVMWEQMAEQLPDQDDPNAWRNY